MTLKDNSVNVTDSADNSSSSDQVQLIWNVVFKDDTALDVFIQSFNFWIQVRLSDNFDITTYAEHNRTPESHWWFGLLGTKLFYVIFSVEHRSNHVSDKRYVSIQPH